MARVKNDLFEVQQGRIAERAKALAHPARIAILQLIAQRNACVCGEIVDELPLAQSTVLPTPAGAQAGRAHHG